MPAAIWSIGKPSAVEVDCGLMGVGNVLQILVDDWEQGRLLSKTCTISLFF